MTWTYSIYDDGTSMDIYEDDPEFSGKIATKTIDQNNRKPDLSIVKEVMRETWEQEANLGSSPVMNVRAGYILMDLVTENIVEGIP